MKNKYLLTSKEKIYEISELADIVKEVAEQNYLEITISDLETLFEIDYVFEKDSLFITAFFIEDTENILTEEILAGFTEEIKSLDDTISLIKIYDSSLRDNYKELYSQIFDLENRLREALMIILSDTYQGEIQLFIEDYNFKAQNSFSRSKSDNLLENELFHLLFTDYIKFESRDSLKKIKTEDLLSRIEAYSTYEELKDSIKNTGIIKQDYVNFLSEIKEHLQNIETVRNCIAHNRALSDKEQQNFDISYPEVIGALENFFDKLGDND